MTYVTSPLLFIAVLVCSISSFGSAQSHAQTWQRLGVDLFDVEWMNANTIVAVGMYGSVLRSEDAGTSWNYVQTGISDDLQTLFSFDSTNALTAGNNGTIMATTDAGETWKRIDFPILNQQIRALGFPNNSSTGLAITYDGTVFRSTNQGSSWEMQGNVDAPILDFTFLGDSICVATSPKGKLYRSTDFGQTWITVYSTDTLIEIRQIATNTATAIAVGARSSQGQHSLILKSTDAGATWQEIQTTAIDFRAQSVYFINGQNIIIAGQRPFTSDILLQRAIYSTDSGKTWEAREINNERGFFNIHAFSFSPENPDRGIAIGTHQGIYLTESGGESWTTRSYARMYEPIDNIIFQSIIYGSYFFDRDTGIAYGSDGFGLGYAFHTTDHGTTWQSIQAGATVRGIYSFGDGTGIAVPASSATVNIEHKLLDMNHDGKDWSLTKKEFDEEYRYYFTSNPIHVTGETLSFTADSMIFESTDRGESWKRVTTVPEILTFSNMQYRDQYGWASVQHNTQSSTFLKSSVLRCNINDRTSWEVVYQDTGASFNILVGGLWFIDDNTGLLGNRKGVLYKTTNSGDTWDSIAQFETGISAIKFFSDSVGLVVGGITMYN